MKKIVILGTGRTASKLYMELFKKCEDVYVLHEVMFDFRYKTDIDSIFKKNGVYKDTQKLESAFHDIFSRSFFRNFKAEYQDKDLLINSLKKLDNITWGKALNTIIETKPKELGKTVSGAKNPVHFSFAPKLLRELNDVKVVYLARDPRALYASEIPMKSKESQLSQFPRLKNKHLQRILIFLYTNMEWVWSMLVYRQIRKKVILCKYEELIQQPEKTVKELFNFVGLPYTKDILSDIPVVGSSHAIDNRGFSKHGMEKWRTMLNGFEKFWFKMLMQIFKY